MPQNSCHLIQLRLICMQTKKEERISEKDQVENTTHRYLKSIWHHNKVLAQFIDFETGRCLTCGHVHSFHNLNEGISKPHNKKISSPFLDRLFWEVI